MSTSPIEQDEPAPTEGHATVPVGFWLLFGGLIAFGAYYFWAYTPWISGWTQDAQLTRPGAQQVGGAESIVATILFTAVAALTAGAIVLAVSRKKKAP